MGNKSRYKRLTNLYARGAEVVFADGTVMWCQALNPFEADEARKDAQAARSRLVLALNEIGSDEHDGLHGVFVQLGRDRVIDDMCGAKALEWYVEAQHTIESDPDWKERIEVLRRHDVSTSATPVEPAELELITKLNSEWLEAIETYVAGEKDYQKTAWEGLTDEELIEKYQEMYVDRRGNEVALAAYNLTEVWYGARECEAVPDEDGIFTKASHEGCNHKVHVFPQDEDGRREVRELEEDLYRMIRMGFEQTAMSAHDARFSDRPGSSSQSSPRPSEGEESAASSQEETSESVPGT